MQELKDRIKELLASGEIDEVIGWKKGEFLYDEEPHIFKTAEEIDNDFVYDAFSAANVSKYLINETLKLQGPPPRRVPGQAPPQPDPNEKPKVIAALLKPCDTYSLNQLLTEHRVFRNHVLAVGIPCDGKVDIDKITAQGAKGVLSVKVEGDKVKVDTIYGEKEFAKEDVILDRCKFCKGTKHVIADERIGCTEEEEVLYPEHSIERFDEVKKIEAMTSEERYNFWMAQFSKCIRCYACRNVCPACSCRTCVFDNPDSNVSSKANTTTAEEQMFHIIRAFHVAGRCTDCGECSRVCPQDIPLHLLNRKFIKDMDENYGEYQAGEVEDQRAPLVNFTEHDIEPDVISDGGKA